MFHTERECVFRTERRRVEMQAYAHALTAPTAARMETRFIRGCRRAVLLVVLCAAACSHGSSGSMLGQRILAFTIDPQTRLVRRVIAALPWSLVQRPPVFHVKTQAGLTTTWQVTRVDRSDSIATVWLASRDRVNLPSANDTVVVFFVDGTATQHVLGPAIVPPPVPPSPGRQ